MPITVDKFAHGLPLNSISPRETTLLASLLATTETQDTRLMTTALSVITQRYFKHAIFSRTRLTRGRISLAPQELTMSAIKMADFFNSFEHRFWSKDSWDHPKIHALLNHIKIIFHLSPSSKFFLNSFRKYDRLRANN